MKSISKIDTTTDISHEQSKYKNRGKKPTDVRPVISARIDEPSVYSEELRALVDPVSVESVSSPNEVTELEGSVVIERNASGEHTIRDETTRREIVELASLRIEEIRQAADAIKNLVPGNSTRVEKKRLQARLAEYKKSVEIEIDEIPELELVLSSDLMKKHETLKEINRDLDYLLEKSSKLKNIKEDQTEVVPAVHYFDSQRPIEDKIAVENLQSSEAYVSLFRIANSSTETVDLSDYSTQQIERRLGQVERYLTTLLNEYREIDKPMEASVSEAVTDPTDGRYTVEISVDEQGDKQFISLSVSDTAEKGFSTPPTERSTGARWLLSFLLGFIELSFTGDEPGLVVYDDPGLPLHPKWKRQLRRILYAVNTEYQVVYSTHSPFLIRNDRASQVRIARNCGAPEHGETDQCGTKIFPLDETAGSSSVHDRLDPVRSSLGAPIAESLFGGERNIIVEGPTDKQYLEAFSSLFTDNHAKLSFDGGTYHMPGNGSNVPVLASFLEVEQPNYVVLTDSDGGGRSIRNRMEESDIPSDKSVEISEAVPCLDVRNPEIEDLLPRSVVCEHVASSTDIERQELVDQAEQYPQWGIVGLIGEKYSVEFPKKDVARKVSGSIDGGWLDPLNRSRLAASLNFASLIHTLRSRLNSEH
jgi:predicted ATP-dependent endonuclease of OLD family